MYMVKAERNKGHKVNYSEARWYFTRKQEADRHVVRVNNAKDGYGSFMYRQATLVQLTNGMKETL